MAKRAAPLRFPEVDALLCRAFRINPKAQLLFTPLCHDRQQRENPQAAIKMVICSVLSPVFGVPGMFCRCGSGIRFLTDVCAETSLAAVVVVCVLLSAA